MVAGLANDGSGSGSRLRKWPWVARISAEQATGDINLRSTSQLREYEAIVDRILRDRPAKLLDWGCGWGQMTALLAEAGIDCTAFDYHEGLGQDHSEDLERYPGLSRYLTGDPIRLPFPDNSFAGVLSCGVLEHVVDPERSLNELHRVLEPGRPLYVYKLPNRRSYLEWIARTSGGLFYYHGKEPNDRTYTPRQARALLERSGFRVLESRFANMLPLTAAVRLGKQAASAVWRANVMLARVPGLNELATNIELVARSY
jgi:ubiquinone/menaquinone biosynthesis C-methylase UbiE